MATPLLVVISSNLERMAKTKMIVKEDQILVDVELIFKEIEEAKGDWKKVWEEFRKYLGEVKEK